MVIAGNTMSLFTSELRPTEITVVVVIVAMLVFMPPLTRLWFAEDAPWYLPYLVWTGIILLCYWLQHKLRKHAV